MTDTVGLQGEDEDEDIFVYMNPYSYSVLYICIFVFLCVPKRAIQSIFPNFEFISTSVLSPLDSSCLLVSPLIASDLFHHRSHLRYAITLMLSHPISYPHPIARGEKSDTNTKSKSREKSRNSQTKSKSRLTSPIHPSNASALPNSGIRSTFLSTCPPTEIFPFLPMSFLPFPSVPPISSHHPTYHPTQKDLRDHPRERDVKKKEKVN